MATRRTVLHGLAGTAAALVLTPALAQDGRSAFVHRLAQLEARHGGRLGVAVSDAARGLALAYRGDTRFLMCSTVKFPLAALILSRVDAGHESLARSIDYGPSDLVTYSPETEQHVARGMRLGDICRAGLTQSDNTAANLMFQAVGGPAALTAFIRGLGDTTTRSDRLETALNEPSAEDKDTTTPRAMRGLMQAVLLGDVLSQGSRNRLLAWMQANQTGDHRLRAGLPPRWPVGDKTGSGGHNTAADIAIVYPKPRHPALITSYYSGSSATQTQRDRVLADVGRAVRALYRDVSSKRPERTPWMSSPSTTS